MRVLARFVSPAHRSGYSSEVRSPWSFTDSSVPVVATAIHAGHDLRPALAVIDALEHKVHLRDQYRGTLSNVNLATL